MTTLHGARVAVLSGPTSGALISEVLQHDGDPLCVAATAEAQLIEAVICNHVDAMVFAAVPQLHYLLSVAAKLGLHGPLIDALNHETIVAAADAACARALWERGIECKVVAAAPGQVITALSAFLAAEIARGRRPDPAVLAEAI